MTKALGLMASLAALTTLALPPAIAQQQPTPEARAELRDAQGNVVGNASFTPTADGVQIQMRVEGFDAAVMGDERGEHGFHIHEVGSCTPPDFSSAGGHYNPTGVDHGLLDPDGPHAGDLPNLWIEADGSADYAVTTNLITVGPGDRTLFDANGSALVIHAEPDDYITDSAGDSGDRLACGVITPVR